VTGAAGKSGLAVTRALSALHVKVRAGVRRADQEAAVIGAGAGEAVVADVTARDELVRAMAGCRGVYLIFPNMHPEEGRLGRQAIEAAQEAGVARLVYHSVLHPLTTKMPPHLGKLAVEEALLESGLVWTVLQPAPYMQNLLGGWSEILEGRYRIPYPVASRMALVDLEDVAEVAARALTNAAHSFATYPLCGTSPLDQHEVAEVLGEEVGRAVQVLQTARADVENGLAAAGLDGYPRETLMAMFDYYADFGLDGNPNVLGWLLGRPPTSLAEFVRRTMDEDATNGESA
jgi:uncharacterized protein YbjT (DUF2867 family)